MCPTSGRTCEQRMSPISVRVRRSKTTNDACGSKVPHPGKAHNVIQKTQRAGERPVLIVDLGIDVAAIGGGDQGGG